MMCDVIDVNYASISLLGGFYGLKVIYSILDSCDRSNCFNFKLIISIFLTIVLFYCCFYFLRSIWQRSSSEEDYL